MGLIDRAKDVAKKAEDLARKGANEARDKGEEMKLRRRLNALAEELGHVTYRQHDGLPGLDDEVTRLVGEMRALRDEIDVVAD